MSEVKAVLLIPEEGDPRGLLEGGPCGAQPPIAQEYADGLRSWWQSGDDDRHAEHWRSRTTPRSWAYRTGRRALVLAWDGGPVAEGLDRLGRAENVTREWVSKVVGFALGWWPDDVDALTDPDLPGTLVFLDAEGREVSDETL